MTTTGEPEVVSERPGASVWDGRRLPGVWLTAKAVAMASARRSTEYARSRSGGAITSPAWPPSAGRDEPGIDGGHRQQRPVLGGCRAPLGGKRPVYSPDPLAVGIPTGGDPILVDVRPRSRRTG